MAPLAAREPLVIQHGHTPPLAGLEADWRAFVPRDELCELMLDASAVICHAGVGCIVTALSLDRRPVVLARRAAHGEHVDDHQLQIAQELDRAGMVALHREGESMDAALMRAAAGAGALGDGRRLRDAVAEATAVRPPRRGARGAAPWRRAAASAWQPGD